MAWSRDPRTPTRYMRGSKRYNDVGGHSPPGDELENTRDHERIWFELKRSRSCCDCTSPGFKYCFDTFDYPSYICDGAFPGGDQLWAFYPGTMQKLGGFDPWEAVASCAGTNLPSALFVGGFDYKTVGSWRNGPYWENLDTGNGLQGPGWGFFFPDVDSTIEMWLRPSSTNLSSGAAILSFLSVVSLDSGGLLAYYRSNGAIAFQHKEIADGALQESGAGWFEADQWHHVAIVRNAATETIGIFINGRLAISRVLPATGWTTTNPTMVLGAGSWSDVAFYSAALSPTIIRRHYQAVYGVEGAANPLSSNDVNIEDPTTVITESIQIDLIDGGGVGQVGYIPVSQGDYTSFVSPEDSPFELEANKSVADGYASLGSDALVPVGELADKGTASDGTFLRGDRRWVPGKLVDAATEIGQILVSGGGGISDLYSERLLELEPRHYWEMTEDSSHTSLADIGSSPLSLTKQGNPTADSAAPLLFTAETSLRMDGTGDYWSSGSAMSAGQVDQWAFSAWVYLEAYPGSEKTLFWDRSGTHGFGIKADGTLHAWNTYFVGGDAAGVTPLTLNTWHHVAMERKYDGSYDIYLDGVLDVHSGSHYVVALGGSSRLGEPGLQAKLGHCAFWYNQGTDMPSGWAADLFALRNLRWNASDPAALGITGGIDASGDDTPVTASPRPRINFKSGTNVTVTVTDDSGDDEVEVEIAASPPAGAGLDVRDNDSDVTASPRGHLNFLDGTGTTVVTTDDGANDEVEIQVDVDHPLPDPSAETDGELLTIASGAWVVAAPDNPLPDPSGETDGDVLTIDSGAWIVATPSAGGGGTGTALVIDVAQTAHGFSVGDVVRRDSGSYALAQADSSANAEVDGIVSAVADVDNFSLTLSGEVTGLSGLTDGETYFLSASSAGALTTTEPSTTGEVSKPLLRATGTTTGLFTNWRGAIVQ